MGEEDGKEVSEPFLKFTLWYCYSWFVMNFSFFCKKCTCNGSFPVTSMKILFF